jgi:hypothetical protein
MKIINKVSESSYVQWIEGFVRDVLKKAELQCNEVTIEDVEFSERIFLTIDGEEHTIRTWDFIETGTDANGETCAENVFYTLYKMVVDKDGSHGEEISNGSIEIAWENQGGQNIMKKIYFIAECEVDGEIRQSPKIIQLVNPDTEKEIFEEVFQITESKDFNEYTYKEEFIATILSSATNYFEEFGKNLGDILFVAVDSKTDICQFGIKLKVLDDDNFQYETLDCKSGDTILKFGV